MPGYFIYSEHTYIILGNDVLPQEIKHAETKYGDSDGQGYTGKFYCLLNVIKSSDSPVESSVCSFTISKPQFL